MRFLPRTSLLRNEKRKQPCGYLGDTRRQCKCHPMQIERYMGKISGPLLDRIDLHLEVPAIPPQELLEAPPGESSADVRARVERAREQAIARQGQPNHALAGAQIDRHAALDPGASQLLHKAALKFGWSARSTHRTLKVARTIADMAGSRDVESSHVAEAMQYRRAISAAA